MTLEELSIVYTADVQPAVDAIHALTAVLFQTDETAARLEDSFFQSGVNAGAGLARGILSAQDRVVSAARAVADAASQALRNALGIHSPSRVTEEMGARFSEGLAGGILSSASLVASAASDLSPSAHSFSHPAFDQVPNAQENIHITIPLEVDGYQLGVAAIEGINRVSRVTGRAELSV